MRDRNLNIAEAAQLLGVDPGTLRRWVERKGLESATNTSFGPMRFKRVAIETFARRAGISLERDQHHPEHYTPPTLAKAAGVGAQRIRELIAVGKIKTIKVPCSPKRVTLMIDQVEGLRVITQFAKARPKAS